MLTDRVAAAHEFVRAPGALSAHVVTTQNCVQLLTHSIRNRKINARHILT
jgi:hypothetical protein